MGKSKKHLEVSLDVHKKLKRQALDKNITIKELVDGILRKETEKKR